MGAADMPVPERMLRDGLFPRVGSRPAAYRKRCGFPEKENGGAFLLHKQKAQPFPKDGRLCLFVYLEQSGLSSAATGRTYRETKAGSIYAGFVAWGDSAQKPEAARKRSGTERFLILQCAFSSGRTLQKTLSRTFRA